MNRTYFYRVLTLALVSVLFLSIIVPISAYADIHDQSRVTASCYRDEFDSSSLAPGWTWVDQLGDSAFSLTVNPGTLHIQTPDGNHDLAVGNTNAPRMVRPVTGAFDIRIKVSSNLAYTYQAAGLVIWIDASNFAWVGRGSNSAVAHHFVRANQYFDPPEVPGIGNTIIYFRAVRNANTVSTYYSLNGLSWVQTGSIDYPSAPATASVGMFLINNWQDNPISADFDYFRDEESCSASTQVFLPIVSKAPLPTTQTVFAVAYMDATPIYDPDEHQALLISSLVQASTWHGYAGQGGVPQLVFGTYGGSVIKLYEPPPHRADNGKFDYAAVYQRFDLCNKIQAGLVDEVWVWESGTGNAWEWVTNGPTWSWTNDSNVPNCGRTITSMNLNYQREIDVALESFGHRLEGLFITTFPCEFFTETWPWTGWPSQCAGLVSDRFGFVARPFSGNNYIGVCGDVHHPPNIMDNREYVYDDLTIVQSICKDWQQDGTAVPSAFNCTEWGCTERGYQIWWMQNLPGAGNNNRDRNGDPMPNWWSYLFR